MLYTCSEVGHSNQGFAASQIHSINQIVFTICLGKTLVYLLHLR